jgi:hypothetical protein
VWVETTGIGKDGGKVSPNPEQGKYRGEHGGPPGGYPDHRGRGGCGDGEIEGAHPRGGGDEEKEGQGARNHRHADETEDGVE